MSSTGLNEIFEGQEFYPLDKHLDCELSDTASVRRKLEEEIMETTQGLCDIFEGQEYYSLDTRMPCELSDTAITILENKYLRGETPEKMFVRVADAVAKPLKNQMHPDDFEKIRYAFYNIMATRDFMPNSPTLMNAGRSFNQLAACFVVPVGDSMEGIFREAIADMALIQRTGGGTGFDFSNLRPKGATVSSTMGESSGPIPFMRAFNACTDTIKQGGARRGANMGILRVDHPDIRDFILLKSNPEEMTNFNLSVAVTDVFMKAVESDEKYDLVHNGKVYGQESAREIWNLISERAWASGEPGVIFIDTINKKNTLPGLGDIAATNPCLTGDTLIKTVEGMIPIKDLVGQEIDVFCLNDQGQLTISTARNIRLTRRQAPLVSVITTKGTVTCTPDHKFYTRNRGYVEAQHLRVTDKLVALCVAPKNQKYVKVYPSGTSAQVQAEHVFIAKHYYGDLTGKDVHHLDNNPKHNVFSNLEVLNHGNHSAVSNQGHINWAEHDPLTGRWLPKVKEKKDWSNKLGVHPVGVNMRLLSVTPLDYVEDVYDMEVDDYHNFFANYVCVHNCGEQPLLPHEACNLGSINLRNCMTPSGFDFAKLKVLTRIAVTFLDCVIDAGKYPLPKISEMAQANRKIGLGVMGFADVCYMQEIGYDSPEAVKLAGDIMSCISIEAKKTSSKLAEIFEPFPNMDKSNYKKPMRNAAITTIAPTGTISMIAGASYGIEPFFALSYTKKLTDTGEVMHFLNEHLEAYMEKYKFSDALKMSIQGYVLKYGTIKGVFEKLKNTPIEINPAILAMEDIFVTAQDIAPVDHVHIQAAFQRHTDNAVSKTINFGNNVGVADIQHIFKLAYKSGCKGITVYRDGCRDSQPLKVDKTVVVDKAPLVPLAMKRPQQLIGVTRQIPTGCGMMLVTVNMDENDQVFEVLMRAGASGGCSAYTDAVARLLSIGLRHGMPLDVLIDQLRSVRCDNFRYQSGKDPSLKGKSCPDVVGRFLQEIVDKQSNKSPDEEVKAAMPISPEQLNSILQEAMINTTGTVGERCPECGKLLLRAEGCMVCQCGYSRC